MADIPSKPNIPRGGRRAQRAAELETQTKTKAKEAQSATGGGAVFRPVKARETLEDIAVEYEASPEEIWEHPLNKQLRERCGTPDELQEGDALYIPGQAQSKLEPVGEGDYVVQEGDSMASIAKDKGYFWKTIWNDSANAQLKEVRQDPNVLLAGDRVTIPTLTPKQEPGETEMRHRFVRRGEPAALKLRVCVEDEPLAGEPYELVIDNNEDKPFTGTTDSDGNIAIPIPGNARQGVLTVGEPGEELVFHLRLGHLSPKDDVKGVQRRLANLGYTVPDTGELDSDTREAIGLFQRSSGLLVTGELDSKTEGALRQKHGS